MLKTFDLLMVGAMIAAATVTYQIKHHAENKRDEVRKLEAEIKLEHDTIDLLKADWALLTQPSRLDKLIAVYARDLRLEPTASTQIARPNELPMLRSQLPPGGTAVATPATGLPVPADRITTGSVKR